MEEADLSFITSEDREQIHALISHYSHTVDSGHLDAWIDLFTDDGEIVSTESGSAKGKEELRIWVERATGAFSGYQIRHIVTNTLLVATSPDRVQARSYVLLTRQAPATASPDPSAMPVTELMATAAVEDEIHRTRRGWKFRSRRVESALPLDPAFVPRRPTGKAG